MTPYACPRCKSPLKPGEALVSTVTGSPDMGQVVTLSPGGPGRLVPVWKCTACGHSITR